MLHECIVHHVNWANLPNQLDRPYIAQGVCQGDQRANFTWQTSLLKHYTPCHKAGERGLGLRPKTSILLIKGNFTPGTVLSVLWMWHAIWVLVSQIISLTVYGKHAYWKNLTNLALPHKLSPCNNNLFPMDISGKHVTITRQLGSWSVNKSFILTLFVILCNVSDLSKKYIFRRFLPNAHDETCDWQMFFSVIL